MNSKKTPNKTGLTKKQRELLDWFINQELGCAKQYIDLHNYRPAATMLRELADRLDGLESALTIFEDC